MRKFFRQPVVLLALLACLLLSGALNAQNRYFTRTGTIDFNAEGVLDDVEEIRAKNSTATCVVDFSTGQMEWAVLMKGFHFKNALMEEHFNENYVESSVYPKAVFKGKIDDDSKIQLPKDGVYPVKVAGELTLHGVTRTVTADGTIAVKAGQVYANSDFQILLSDYDIKIPSIVGNKVSKEVAVSVAATLDE